MIKLFSKPYAKLESIFLAGLLKRLFTMLYILLGRMPKEKPYRNDRVGTFKMIGI